MSEDQTFGPMLLFGAGGTAVEVMQGYGARAAAARSQACTRSHAPDASLSAARGLSRPPGGEPRCHRRAFWCAQLLVAIHPEIRELDINPLLADEKGCIALDARMRVADAGNSAARPLAIRPYPVGLGEGQDSVPASGPVLLRPIRPEDEGLYARFFERSRADDVHMRFFTAAAERSHRFLARLTQIDYAREMAFVAIDENGDELLGVVEPDRRSRLHARRICGAGALGPQGQGPRLALMRT